MNIQGIKNIGFLILMLIVCSLGLVSCHEELYITEKDNISDNELTISGTFVIPDLNMEVTRGVFGNTPSSAVLKLSILEFDLGNDAAHSFLTNIYHADLKSSSAVANNGEVGFSFTVNASASPKVFHLMLTDNYIETQFGSVATILPTLSVTHDVNGREAYWGFVEFHDGLIDIDENGYKTLKSEVTTALTKVPMIRNFARISVTENLDNFELLGFDIVNAPTAGTIAPWDQSKLQVPSLITGSTMKPYSSIDYKGIIPGTATFRNTETQARQWNASSTNMLNRADRYMYEHPYEPARRTYVIIHGRYTTGTVTTSGFYKIDIGHYTDETFRFYNILRNIHYKITITSVSAPGMATVSQAIDSAPFNNLSASTETADMLSVSDGVNLLTVNDTNHVIVNDNQEVEVLFRYIEDIRNNGGTENNGVPYPVNLTEGPVIKSFSETPVAYTDKNGVNWMKLTINCNNPTDEVQTQSFIIVDGTGLGRIINLILRKPWEYAPLKDRNGDSSGILLTVAKGYSRSFPYTQLQPEPQEIGAGAQANLTVYFSLPDGLPETMFPLDFYIEAKYQGIENNKIDNMVVYTGPSLFNPDILAISYIKSVSYEEYMLMYTNDTSNELNVDKLNSNHVIACRFQTITSVTSGSTAEIRVHNDYFKPDVSVQFTRK